MKRKPAGPSSPMKGYVHIYTGDGKGKTTSALGLLLRASGANLRILLLQFMKSGLTSEIKTLRQRFPDVKVSQCGTGSFIRGQPTPAAIAKAGRGLATLRRALLSVRYDVVIADEINTAVKSGLIPLEEVLDLMDIRPDSVELILTGRGAHPAMIRKAHLVTEMKCVKHYYHKGISARNGIEK